MEDGRSAFNLRAYARLLGVLRTLKTSLLLGWMRSDALSCPVAALFTTAKPPSVEAPSPARGSCWCGKKPIGFLSLSLVRSSVK